MDSSNRSETSRPRRRPTVLSPETLEGRQLLSTTAAATDSAATDAVTTAADVSLSPTATGTPVAFHRVVRAGHAHMGGFGLRQAGRFHGISAGTLGTGMASTMLPFTAPSANMVVATPSGSTQAATIPSGTMTTLDPSGTMTVTSDPSGIDPSSASASSLAPVTIGQKAGFTVSDVGFGSGELGGFTPGGPMMISGSGLGGGGAALGGGFARGVAVTGMGGGLAQGWYFTGGPGSTGSPGSTSTDPAATALKQYQADVQAIADKSQVTPALQAALRKDLQALSKDATTAADPSKVLAFESDVKTLAGVLPTGDQLATLQADFTAVATSEGITDSAAIAQTFTDLNALVAATNITASDVATLTADLKAAGLSTAAPLGPGLGTDLGILNLAIRMDVGATSTSAATDDSSTS